MQLGRGLRRKKEIEHYRKSIDIDFIDINT